MEAPMLRILVAYDGSECSEKALLDLKKAGLSEQAQAVVLTVADRWIEQSAFIDYPVGPYVLPDSTLDYMASSLQEAEGTAKKGAETLKQYFPRWEIDSRSVAGSAAEGVIDKIDEWKPDLVVMGSHGRSAPGRILFGSVSQKVLTHVHCNLRVSRGRDLRERGISPLRILIPYDGSQESETAFESALCRHWPKGTTLRVITVLDMKVSTAFLRPMGPIRFWTTDEDKNPVAWVDRMLSYQKQRIEEKGLIAYTEALSGDPKRILLKQAELWGADTIFVGPRGLTGRKGVIAGSVSTALAMHAHCSVEIVHRLWSAKAYCENPEKQHRDTLMEEPKIETK
jgi:nucleotide-binding universal stress UspA family protein